MRKVLLFLVTSFIISPCFGQESILDSLETVLSKTKEDSTKITLLQQYIQKAFHTDLQRGLPFSDSLLLYSKKVGDFKNETAALRYKGNYYMYSGNYDKAETYFKESLTINHTNDYEEGIYADYSSLGNVMFYDSEFDGAKRYYKKALEVMKSPSLKKRYSSALMNLANAYYQSEDNERAIVHYLQAIDSSHYLPENEKNRIVPIYINLGTVFLDLKNYRNAEKYLKEGLGLAEEINFKQGIADGQLKLGRSYYENNTNLDESEELLLNCIKSYKELGDTYYLTNAYINLGDLYLVKNELEKSIRAKSKAVELAEKNGLTEYYLGAVSSIAETYFKQKKFNNSLEKVNSILKDTIDPKMNIETKLSLYKLKAALESYNKNYRQAYIFSNLYTKEFTDKSKRDKIEVVNEIEEKYQNEKKDKENMALRAETAEKEALLAQTTKRNWQLGGGLATSIIGLGIFFIAYRKNNRQKIEIERQKNKVEHLQKELHHRLKNNLAFIDVFIALAKDKFTDPRYQQKLTELQNRIKSMFEVHKQLFHHENIASVNAASYISKLAENVKSAYANPNIKIQQDVSPNDEVDSHISFPIGIIVNEFITNSYKYAFTPEKSGVITISLKETNKQYQLTLKDNGKGLPQNFDIRHIDTFGLDSIKLLTEEYDGSFSLQGEKGVTLNITLPKKAA